MNDDIIRKNYAISFDDFVLKRDSGSIAYSAVSEGKKYFLRVIKPAFFDTAVNAIQVQAFLQNKGFPVPPIIHTNDGKTYVHEKREDGNYLYVMYDYIEGTESEPEQDAEKIGTLIGKLHSLMKSYNGSLVKREKHFYIGRYLDILHKKQYKKVDEFEKYSNSLWDKIKDLPCGFCHGDMYCGNIHKTPEGELYLLDFDTSCEGFPIYDLALICNMTDYFTYDESRFENTKHVFEKMLPAYQKFNPISQAEINSLYDMIALYHFALQATIIEIHGIDCVDSIFLDNQLEWLYKWQEQCERNNDNRKIGNKPWLMYSP